MDDDKRDLTQSLADEVLGLQAGLDKDAGKSAPSGENKETVGNKSEIGPETAERQTQTPPIPHTTVGTPIATHNGQEVPIDSASADEMVPNLKEAKRDILKTATHAQRHTLQVIVNLLERIEVDASITNTMKLKLMMDAARVLADLRLTHEWSEKLKEAIKKNPGNLTRPNDTGTPILNHLKTLAGKTKIASKRDGREGVNKQAGLDMPEDED